MGAGLPALVGTLVALAVIVMWLATAPSRKRDKAVDSRLGQYIDRTDVVGAEELARPFRQRALLPLCAGPCARPVA